MREGLVIFDDPRPQQYADRAYSEIKQMAINYTLKPTEQINIEELAHKLNMSVTPVREALNRLLNEDILVRRGSRGFCNRPIDLTELKELFELRGILIIGSIRALVKKKTKDEIDAIASRLEGCDDQNDLSRGATGQTLIDELVLLGENHELAHIYQRVRDRISFIWGIYLATPLGKARFCRYERQLGSALLSRDLPECVRVIDENVVTQIDSLNEVAKDGLAALYVAA
jgi:DNA-binding GntR family transcriptional regulator